MNIQLPENLTEHLTQFGITPHPTWQIMDSTKGMSWACRRAFFYEYVLGWRPETTSNHLVFGNAFHIPMEVIHEAQNFDEKTIIEGYIKGEEFYRRDYPADSDEIYAPKTMTKLLKGLMEYAEKYHRDFEDNETKYVEVGGSVPIRIEPTERRLHFRMDALMHNKRQDYYFCREHKTSTATGMFRNKWRSDFELRLQIGTYTHAMYCIFPRHQVRGVEVNGAFWRKAKSGPTCEFERVPCWWQPPRMSQWLWTMNNIFDELEYEFERLALCTEDEEVMQCFPINERLCNEYLGCPYHSFCTAWSNPLRECSEPPMGFKEERWDPSEIESLKHKMNLQMGDE